MSAMYDYKTIVVGTDGSPLAEPTVARAAWLAAHNDSDLVIVCAYSALSRRQEARNVATVGGDSRIGQVLGRAAANDALSSATSIARENGATLSASLLVDGEPAQALLDVADERDADLVVVGARHDVSLAERLLGTVATEVVRRAPCEVLIVRPRSADVHAPESQSGDTSP
jgi:nucleotide-binding universal stress UspA family protein